MPKIFEVKPNGQRTEVRVDPELLASVGYEAVCDGLYAAAKAAGLHGLMYVVPLA